MVWYPQVAFRWGRCERYVANRATVVAEMAAKCTFAEPVNFCDPQWHLISTFPAITPFAVEPCTRNQACLRRWVCCRHRQNLRWFPGLMIMMKSLVMVWGVRLSEVNQIIVEVSQISGLQLCTRWHDDPLNHHCLTIFNNHIKNCTLFARLILHIEYNKDSLWIGR